MNADYKRILIILPRQLGDVLLGTPLAQVLRQNYPCAQIDWWAHPMAKQLLDGNPNLSNVFYYPVWKKKKEDKLSLLKVFVLWLKFLYLSVSFVFKIRAQKYDVVIDAMNNPRTSLQTFICASKVRISFSVNPTRNFIYNYLLPREKLDDCYLGHARLFLLEPLGIHLSTKDRLKINPLLPISEKEVIRIKNWLKENKIQNEQKLNSIEEGKFKYVVLSPTHRHAVRRWPGNHYVDLALKIIEQTDLSIVWLWGPGEESLVFPLHESLQARLKSKGLSFSLSLLPPLFTLREAAVLSQFSKVWVGNSNGLSHVAVAAGANTIELHGPTVPQSWCHPNYAKHRALQRSVGCVRCSSNTCKFVRRECLEDLSAEDVFNEIKYFID